MTTLLQTLLNTTLPEDSDPILQDYFETVLPSMEQHYGTLSALGGNDPQFCDRPDQNLCVHCLNALLIAWNLSKYLPDSLDEQEQYLLCLGITLHDYNKYCHGNGEAAPMAYEIPEILQLCEELGNKLNFTAFWNDWQLSLVDIAYLAQNTQFKSETNPFPTNWEECGHFTADPRRLKKLRHLLGFGDIAVHMQDAGDIVTTTRGDRLREHLKYLGLARELRYHRLRDTIGILTNAIHNATMESVRDLGWEPLLFFAQGVVYLVPKDADTANREALVQPLWTKVSGLLAQKMFDGDVGFKRDGKGLKVSPQTNELIEPAMLIRGLPKVVINRVQNAKNPATPKRLQKLRELGKLTEEEYTKIENFANLSADRLAELILVVQREFFADVLEFNAWILEYLGFNEVLAPEEVAIVLGGVNYGWYRVAAHVVAQHRTWDDRDLENYLVELAEAIATWAEEHSYLPEHESPTREVFAEYLDRYLDLSGWPTSLADFEGEVERYAIAKTRQAKQPICALSSGEFLSEDQMDSVVLFKPQQYSNKNPLGGRKIKRGISKIWALEMLLRQSLWSARAGKFEDEQPVFLYLFPAYVYAPQVIKALRILSQDVSKNLNLWEVAKRWNNMLSDKKNSWLSEVAVSETLQGIDWIVTDSEAGRFANSPLAWRYDAGDLPFVATIFTKTRGKTTTDAWIQPLFLALALSRLLGVRVSVTSSNVPLYASDRDFLGSVQIDGAANFWTLLARSPTQGACVRVQEIEGLLKRLLVVYSLHLENRSNPPDARWHDLKRTVQEVTTDVLNVFAIAESGLRDKKRDAKPAEVRRYWRFAEIWSEDDSEMQEKLEFMRDLVASYRTFYQVRLTDSSHAILLPLTKVLGTILAIPPHIHPSDVIAQAAGQLKDAIDRQPAYTRPLILDKSVPYEERLMQELQAIHAFTRLCVEDLFGKQYKGDRALLQENRNRIKSGAEFAYRMLSLEASEAAKATSDS